METQTMTAAVTDEVKVEAIVQCGVQTFAITNKLIAGYRKLTGVASNTDALVLLTGSALMKPTPRQVRLGGVVAARHHGMTPDGGALDAKTATCACGEKFLTGSKGTVSRVIHMGKCAAAYANGKAFEERMHDLLDAYLVEVQS